MTLRATLEQASKSSKGKLRDPRLDQVILIPFEGQYVLDVFWELRAGIGGSGFGPNPIGQLDIFCWGMNHGTELSPGEIEIILALDNTYLEHASKQIEKESKTK